MRLIEGDGIAVSLKFVADKLSDGSDWIVGYKEGLLAAATVIEEAPTIDPEELRPKGRWVLRDDKGNGVCNHCNRQDKIDPMATHCRYCGAKMEVDNGES